MNNLPNDQPLAISHQPLVKTGGGHPEKEPVGNAHLKEVEVAPEIPPEVKRVGVEVLDGEIKLSPQARKSGISEAAEATPITGQAIGVNPPLTENQVEKALHQKITESILWLATWWLRQLQTVHRKLRKIGS